MDSQVAARQHGVGGRTSPHGRRARHHPARQVRARYVQERRCAQRGAVPPPLHVGHGQPPAGGARRDFGSRGSVRLRRVRQPHLGRVRTRQRGGTSIPHARPHGQPLRNAREGRPPLRCRWPACRRPRTFLPLRLRGQPRVQGVQGNVVGRERHRPYQ